MSNTKKKKFSVLYGFLRAIISLSIISIAAAIGAWFYFNPVHTEKAAKHEQRKVYVTTMPISFGDFPVEIEVMGKISPAREMTLKAQVSGEIVWVSENFIPGGFFEADEHILEIDPADYLLAVEFKRAAYKQAKAAYQLEEGRQQIAKNDFFANSLDGQWRIEISNGYGRSFTPFGIRSNSLSLTLLHKFRVFLISHRHGIQNSTIV